MYLITLLLSTRTESDCGVRGKERERDGRREQKRAMYYDGQWPWCVARVWNEKESIERVCACASLQCWGPAPLVLNAEEARSGHGKSLQGLPQ